MALSKKPQQSVLLGILSKDTICTCIFKHADFDLAYTCMHIHIYLYNDILYVYKYLLSTVALISYMSMEMIRERRVNILHY